MKTIKKYDFFSSAKTLGIISKIPAVHPQNLEEKALGVAHNEEPIKTERKERMRILPKGNGTDGGREATAAEIG